jgi:hypothetical protein
MEVLERKAQLMKAIDIADENTLNDLEVVCFVNSKHDRPCQYSIEELNIRAEQGIKDAENGLGKSIGELRKKHPLA